MNSRIPKKKSRIPKLRILKFLRKKLEFLGWNSRIPKKKLEFLKLEFLRQEFKNSRIPNLEFLN